MKLTIHGREFELKNYAYIYDGTRLIVTGHPLVIDKPILRGKEDNKNYIVPKSEYGKIFSLDATIKEFGKNRIIIPCIEHTFTH